MRYHGDSAKRLIGEVLALAVLDAKKGNEDALLWLYTEPCEAYLLLLDAVEPKRFRSLMASRYGLPKGFSALIEKPRPLYGELPPLPSPPSPKHPTPPLPAPLTQIEMTTVPTACVFACQYGFKELLALPVVAMRRRCEDCPKNPQRLPVFFQKRFNPYVLDFSEWGARV